MPLFVYNRNKAFTAIGVNVVPTVDAMVMRHVVPENERIAVQPGDFIGIFHINNEIGLTYCNENVTPEHSHWMTSDNWVRY